MKLRSATAVFLALSTFLWAGADPGPDVSGSPHAAEIIARYVEAIRAEQAHPQAVSMEVDMDATLPRLKKEGRLHAFRFITRLGKIFYDAPRYEGDSTIKKEVIARYIAEEKKAREENDGSLAITPENYRFKYKGVADYAGSPAHVFQVNPKKKRLGLYKGELWIDTKTYLPFREWGELVKSPSMFVKNIYFVRDYTIKDGMAVPRRVISDVNTRIAGQAKLTIWYENVKVGDAAPVPTAALANGSPDKVRTDGSSQ